MKDGSGSAPRSAMGEGGIRREILYHLIALCRDDNSKNTLQTMGENHRYSKDGETKVNKL
jgi:hypothetical protein